MSMLVGELAALGADPLSWGAVPALLVFAGVSYRNWRVYPLLQGDDRLTEAKAAALAGRPQFAGPRYALLMLGGIAATVAGLWLIAEGIRPTLAFYLLLAGVFVIQTEPARLQIREAQYAAIAARPHGEEASQAARERLDWTNAWLVTLEVVILAGTVLFLCAV